MVNLLPQMLISVLISVPHSEMLKVSFLPVTVLSHVIAARDIDPPVHGARGCCCGTIKN